MTNGNDSMHPKPVLQENYKGDFIMTGTSPGLTKREYFAGLAMQGMLANDWRGYAAKESECDALAQAAVNFADALMAALNTKQQ